MFTPTVCSLVQFIQTKAHFPAWYGSFVEVVLVGSKGTLEQFVCSVNITQINSELNTRWSIGLLTDDEAERIACGKHYINYTFN